METRPAIEVISTPTVTIAIMICGHAHTARAASGPVVKLAM
jgi:hypothetical protein